MIISPEPTEYPSSDELAALERARTDVLRVHRALLAAERQRYEAHHGLLGNNSAFLQLVIADAWFAWIKPMTQLVLLIDERTSDKKSPLGRAEALSLTARANTLLRPDVAGAEFQRLLHRAAAASPELAFLVRQVERNRSAVPPPRG